MVRACRLVRAGAGGEASWRREDDTLVISPAAEPPLAVPIAEIRGIAGDGFTIRLSLPEGDIALERLGGDGPTLLEELRRDWLPLRAAALRLAGAARPAELYAGHIASPALNGPFRGFFAEERLVVAPEGGDVAVLFPADFASVVFDEREYAVRLRGWDDASTTIGRLGGRSAAFAAALTRLRGELARVAQATTAARLPTLPAVARASLAAKWLPGRLLSFEALEALAPGFAAAFTASWLQSCPRRAEGERLIEGAAQTDRFLGYAPGAGDEDPFLWLLARDKGSWTLELLSHGDWATYLFESGGELLSLVEGLMRLPEFSREALYLPLEQLTGERAAYAIAARDLPLLRELRARYTGRRVHVRDPIRESSEER